MQHVNSSGPTSAIDSQDLLRPHFRCVQPGTCSGPTSAVRSWGPPQAPLPLCAAGTPSGPTSAVQSRGALGTRMGAVRHHVRAHTTSTYNTMSVSSKYIHGKQVL